jgi:hypothetical protein
MAAELAPDDIRVNIDNPVTGETGLLADFMGEDTPPRRAQFIATIPLGRLSQPSDVRHGRGVLRLGRGRVHHRRVPRSRRRALHLTRGGRPHARSTPAGPHSAARRTDRAIGPLAMDIYLASMPSMTHALSASPEQVQLTLSVYMYGWGVAQLFAGPSSDRFGRRPALIAGLAVFSVRLAGVRRGARRVHAHCGAGRAGDGHRDGSRSCRARSCAICMPARTLRTCCR